VRRRIDEAVSAARAEMPAHAPMTARVSGALMQIRAEADVIEAELTRPVPASLPVVPQRQREESAAPTASPISSEGLSKPEQRIVDAIAWWHSAGIPQPSRHQVAFVAGYTVNGHFNNQIGTLRSRGAIDYPAGSCVALTAAGSAMANAPSAKPTRAQLIDRVRAVLKGEPMRRIFDVLVTAGGPLTRDRCARSAGYTVNGHFNNQLGALVGIGVAEYPGRGTVALSSIFGSLK
jgi:hypothetical protein